MNEINGSIQLPYGFLEKEKMKLILIYLRALKKNYFLKICHLLRN